jgi:hypothetical protein
MRIDRTNPLDIAANAGGQPAPKSDAGKQAPAQMPAQGVELQLGPETQRYLQLAREAADVDPGKVAAARDALDSGRLESSESIQRTAEILLNLGV